THLSRDRARTKAFQVSELGLIEMTRQRVRQSHLQSMTEACPTCHGTGRVFTAETVTRRIERSIRRAALEGKKDPLVVRVHPDVALLRQQGRGLKPAFPLLSHLHQTSAIQPLGPIVASRRMHAPETKDTRSLLTYSAPTPWMSGKSHFHNQRVFFHSGMQYWHG